MRPPETVDTELQEQCLTHLRQNGPTSNFDLAFYFFAYWRDVRRAMLDAQQRGLVKREDGRWALEEVGKGG